MEKVAVIVAGGMGRRMQSPVPKQFMMLAGKPVIFYSVDIFLQYDPTMEIILALPENNVSSWENLCDHFHIHPPVKIAPGGDTRFHSVKSALRWVSASKLVAVHDAVRPLVAMETIARVFTAAESSGAAIPVIPPAESLRRVNQNESVPVDRNEYVLVQTPQVFHSDILLKAYQQEYDPAFTDDASVVQKAGFPITLVEGSPENLKITSPADLKMAEFLLQEKYNK